MTKTARPGGVGEMMALALPMIVSYGCDTVMMFCDRLLLSRLGPGLMNAAVGGGIAAFMMASFGFGLFGYGTALVAQYFGAGEKSVCPRVTTQCLITALFLYPFVLFARPFVHGLFRKLGLPPDQVEAQIAFFDVMTYGSILVFARQSLASFFSGVGRTGVVMAASLTAMVVNVAVSYTLIYGRFGAPALGIRGAAFGTLTGSLAAVLVLLAAYSGKRGREEFEVHRSLVFDAAVFRKLLRFGSPSGVEFFLTLLAANAFVISFQSLGPVVATASSILINWDMTAYIPLMGMEVGVTSLVGRYMGARRPDLAHRAVMSGLKVGFVYAAALLLVFGFFSGHLVAIFDPGRADPVFAAARPLAVSMLRMISIYAMNIVLVIVFVGALRGAGDTLWAMTYHVSLHWMWAGAVYVGTRVLGFSALQAWGLVIALFMLFSGVAWLRYRGGKWKAIHVID